MSNPGSYEDKTSKNSTSDGKLPCSSQGIDFPEGGIEAWCTVFGAFLVQFCGTGYVNAFGVYQAFYAREFLQNESASAISWIGSLDAFIMTGLGPICGPLFDSGYFYHVYITGAVLQSLSIFMLSSVQPGKYNQVLLLQGITCGIGQGLVYVPSFAILSHHFKRRRAAMMTVAASGASLGGITHTIMLNKLLDSPLGFKMGVRISATFITVLLFLSCVLVRTRYSAVRQQSAVNIWKATKKCFTEIPSLLTIIGFMFFRLTSLYPVFYFQEDSLKHGLSGSFSFYSLVLINGGSFLSRIAISALIPFIGVIDLTIIATVVCGILIIGMIWLGSVASVVVLGVLYGLFSGVGFSLMGPMYGLTADPEEVGVRLGMGYTTSGFGGLIGTPICGALLTHKYRWWAPALFSGVIMMIGGAFFVGVRISFRHAHGTAGGESKGEITIRNESEGNKGN